MRYPSTQYLEVGTSSFRSRIVRTLYRVTGNMKRFNTHEPPGLRPDSRSEPPCSLHVLRPPVDFTALSCCPHPAARGFSSEGAGFRAKGLGLKASGVHFTVSGFEHFA